MPWLVKRFSDGPQRYFVLLPTVMGIYGTGLSFELNCLMQNTVHKFLSYL